MIKWITKIARSFGNIFAGQNADGASPEAKGKNDNELEMKYLVVGLGNMGAEYDNTRHNIGFEVVDGLAKAFEAKFEHEMYGDLAKFKHKGRTIFLLKPSTYMNLSGKAVNYWLQKLKIKAENLLIVTDDIHLDFGRHRLRLKGSDAGHNGLKDIEARLGSSKYPRLRIGIGSNFYKGQQSNYVLGQWSRKEEESIQDIIIKAGEMVKGFATIGAARTMSQYNS